MSQNLAVAGGAEEDVSLIFGRPADPDRVRSKLALHDARAKNEPLDPRHRGHVVAENQRRTRGRSARSGFTTFEVHPDRYWIKTLAIVAERW
jgi:hypothetical protein